MYKPRYRITPYLLKLVEKAALQRSAIENSVLQVSWLPALQKESKAKRAHSSTSIEGNPLSLEQVQELARGGKIGAGRVDEQEVENYLKVMGWLENKYPVQINEKNLLKLHALLMESVSPPEKCGHYKKKQNYIVNEKHIKIFTPPGPRVAPGLVKELLDWINSQEAKELNSVIVCAIFHHRFVSIHPFSDGNGRLARAIGTWVLYKRGFDTKHIFSLDDYFAGDRKLYYMKIQQARELDDDLTHWIEYVAEGIVATLKDVRKRIEALKVKAKSRIILTSRQEDILRILRDNALIRGSSLTKKLGITRSRMNQLLMPLIQKGLIKKQGQSRATSYRLNV